MPLPFPCVMESWARKLPRFNIHTSHYNSPTIVTLIIICLPSRDDLIIGNKFQTCILHNMLYIRFLALMNYMVVTREGSNDFMSLHYPKKSKLLRLNHGLTF